MSPPMAEPTRPPPPRPLAPSDSDCCRSDCPNCVFTLYERELERWTEQMEAWLAGNPDTDPAQASRPS